MKAWFFRRRPAAEPCGGGCAVEEPPAEAQMEFGGPEPDGVPSEGWFELPQPRVRLEIDDGVTVPVAGHAAHLTLEATQRIREYREREKSSVPPVYNFGGDSWSAADS